LILSGRFTLSMLKEDSRSLNIVWDHIE